MMTKTYQLDPENARTHPDENKALVNTSLKTLGGGRSILVDGDGIVRAGNKTYEEAVALGMEIVEVETKPNQLVAVKRPDLKGADAVRMGLIDNQATDTSHFDGEILLKLAEKYGEEVVQEGVFSEDEWQELVKHVEEPETGDAEPQIDRAAELQEIWQVQPGELFELGNHRLICGDCTDAATVEKVLNGEKVELVFTSPPYNKGTTTGNGFHGGGKTTHLTGGYKNYKDNRTHAEYAEWQSTLLKNWYELLTDDGAIYYNHRPRTQNNILEYALLWNPGLPIRQIVIWYSGSGANLTPSSYVSIHEWIVIFAKPNFGLLDRSSSGFGDVWHYPSSKVDGHPVPFPVELPEIALKSTGKMIAYDPFQGSGSVMVACERLNRKFRGCELAPEYIAVTLQRFTEAFPGLEIRRYPA